MVNQEQVWQEIEADRWFERNREAMKNRGQFDWVTHLIKKIRDLDKITSIAELGCATGWRLHQLGQSLNCQTLAGIDPSAKAIAEGQALYPELDLRQGSLSNVPFNKTFGLVIVAGVFCVVERQVLIRSMSEVDRVTQDGGFLLIGDFLPDYPQRRRWHHLPNEQVYAYKQDYAQAFLAAGLYKEIARLTFNADNATEPGLAVCDSGSRYGCVLLQKSLYGFYPEV